MQVGTRLTRPQAASAATAPLNYQPLQQLAYERIRASILAGDYTPGQSLNIRALATGYGVSSIPVREALRRLEAEGLVGFLPNRGATIRQLSRAELEEVFLMRVSLETLALKHALPRLSSDDLAELDTLVAQLHPRRTQPARWYEAHRQFHFRLYRAAELPRLNHTIVGLWGLIAPYFGVYAVTAPDFQKAYSEHVELLQAFRSRDVMRSTKLLQAHMTEAHRVVMDGLVGHAAEPEPAL
jgi:DNA-binding GntR family transcriptional regulator